MKTVLYIYYIRNNIRYDKKTLIGETGLFTPKIIFVDGEIRKKSKIKYIYDMKDNRKYMGSDFLFEMWNNKTTQYTVSNFELTYKIPLIKVSNYLFAENLIKQGSNIKIVLDPNENKTVMKRLNEITLIHSRIKKLTNYKNSIPINDMYLCMNHSKLKSFIIVKLIRLFKDSTADVKLISIIEKSKVTESWIQKL